MSDGKIVPPAGKLSRIADANTHRCAFLQTAREEQQHSFIAGIFENTWPQIDDFFNRSRSSEKRSQLAERIIAQKRVRNDKTESSALSEQLEQSPFNECAVKVE